MIPPGNLNIGTSHIPLPCVQTSFNSASFVDTDMKRFDISYCFGNDEIKKR